MLVKKIVFKIILQIILIFLIESKQYIQNGDFSDISCLDDSTNQKYACGWKKWGWDNLNEKEEISPLFQAYDLSNFYPFLPKPSIYAPLSLCVTQKIPLIQKGTYTFRANVRLDPEINPAQGKIGLHISDKLFGFNLLVSYPTSQYRPNSFFKIQKDFQIKQNTVGQQIRLCKFVWGNLDEYGLTKIYVVVVNGISITSKTTQQVPSIPTQPIPNCQTETLINSKSICITCRVGFTLNNGGCIKQVTFCSVYSNEKCIRCIEGYQLIQPQNICIKLPANCINVQLSGQCTQCQSGFQLIEKNCIKIPSDCIQLKKNGFCQLCKTGFQLVSNTCVTIPANCVKVNLNGQCLVCIVGFEIKNQQCIKKPLVCASNQYINSDNVCQNGAVENCKKFQSPSGQCTQCKSGYYQSSKILCCPMDTKNSTFIVVNGKCVEREINCVVFFDYDNVTCLTCKPGFYLFQKRCYKVVQRSENTPFGLKMFNVYSDVWGNYYVQGPPFSFYNQLNVPLKITSQGYLYIETSSYQRLYFSGPYQGRQAFYNKTTQKWQIL